mmetsp:Transcript_40265/g.99642  ORF Transcript_40265/g.99642 Transcript_40265/m.99642 type:complete len:278 (-) Transcript_40265:549-1382(-)
MVFKELGRTPRHRDARASSVAARRGGGHSLGPVLRLRHAKVADAHRSILRQQHVARLHVSVDDGDVAHVQVGDARGCFRGYAPLRGRVEDFFWVAKELVQRAAIAQHHDDPPALGHHAENAQDVGVVQGAHDHRLTAHHLHHGGGNLRVVDFVASEHHLDGDGFAAVRALEDGAVPSAAEHIFVVQRNHRLWNLRRDILQAWKFLPGHEAFEIRHLDVNEAHVALQVGHDEVREALEAVLEELAAEERLEEYSHDAEDRARADEAEGNEGAGDGRDR